MSSESLNKQPKESSEIYLTQSEKSSSTARKIDSSDYVQRCRITKSTPPSPAYNPMQFVAVKPVTLFKPLEKQENLDSMSRKSTSHVKHDDAEEWQSDLDSWKCSRRKRVEHIIDRVVEVKKLESIDYELNKRKSKTFSEMIEKRGAQRKISVSIFKDDENDLSDLGISKKTPQEIQADQYSSNEKTKQHYEKNTKPNNKNLDLMSNDQNELTYQNAIDKYKSRVKQVAQYGSNMKILRKTEPHFNDNFLSIDLENGSKDKYLMTKNDLPKTDFAKRRELFELNEKPEKSNDESGVKSPAIENIFFKNFKERISCFERDEIKSKDENQTVLNCDKTSKNISLQKTNLEDVPIIHSIKERVSNLQACFESSSEVKINCYSNKDVDIIYENKEKSINKDPTPPTLESNIGNSTYIVNDENNISLLVSQSIEEKKSKLDQKNATPLKTTQNDIQLKLPKIELNLSTPDLVQYDGNYRGEKILNHPDNKNVFEVLDNALQEIDNEMELKDSSASMHNSTIIKRLNDVETEIGAYFFDNNIKENYKESKNNEFLNDNSYYQAPQTKPIPFYENVTLARPPKEKPPPPPIENEICDITGKLFMGSSLTDKKKYKSKPIYIKQANNTDVLQNNEFCELRVPNSPIMIKFLEDQKLQRKFLKKGFTDSDTGESRDSGVSENHSRQSSGPISFEELQEASLKIHNILDLEIKALNENLLEQETRELNIQDRQNNNVTHRLMTCIFKTDHRKSMPELPLTKPYPHENQSKGPAKPLPSQTIIDSSSYKSVDAQLNRQSAFYSKIEKEPFFKIKSPLENSLNDDNVLYANKKEESIDINALESNTNTFETESENWYLNSNNKYNSRDKIQWPIQEKSENKNFFNHWLIQEAEQRRIDQLKKACYRNKKSLPDSVIQTITQRVKNMGIGCVARYNENLRCAHNHPKNSEEELKETALSVSGKKKCTFCHVELGRGAAMIIESLQLFYHIECFKCFVCHVPLGDGLGGIDVRVRNYKLHCQNCYSNDEGVKFSCV
ncbi:uncharacterized protein LOC134837482 [Culicoides brevitarsis]|uniref:uncharacterized protein LOC134837482 n=1 Tax=Culicoides brevitarsis TaxID=469753 RepID=UPI00307C41F1